ncbi:hypothetical protein BJ322DRAFT_1019283 [Thelephora terrestris]|uniref:Uncharacterized protein n=1 Tax=Thelephora terrestris TaxID=56493 RepID=A0A9P6HH20_9AGAM|nr:hypothetical protein BJ322DRAFT_1019283 [Thelephora terrestris]
MSEESDSGDERNDRYRHQDEKRWGLPKYGRDPQTSAGTTGAQAQSWNKFANDKGRSHLIDSKPVGTCEKGSDHPEDEVRKKINVNLGIKSEGVAYLENLAPLESTAPDVAKTESTTYGPLQTLLTPPSEPSPPRLGRTIELPVPDNVPTMEEVMDVNVPPLGQRSPGLLAAAPLVVVPIVFARWPLVAAGSQAGTHLPNGANGLRRESQAPLSLMGSLLGFLHRERSCPSPGWFPVPSKASRPWEWHPTPQLVRIPPIKLISVPRAATAFPLSPLPLTIYAATVLGLSVLPARDDVEPVSPNSQTNRVVRTLDQESFPLIRFPSNGHPLPKGDWDVPSPTTDWSTPPLSSQSMRTPSYLAIIQ